MKNSKASDRPIRPQMVGITVGALWAAVHMPQLLNVSSIAEVTAEALAAAIVAGGTLAVMAEATSFSIRLGRMLLRQYR